MRTRLQALSLKPNSNSNTKKNTRSNSKNGSNSKKKMNYINIKPDKDGLYNIKGNIELKLDVWAHAYILSKYDPHQNMYLLKPNTGHHPGAFGTPFPVDMVETHLKDTISKKLEKDREEILKSLGLSLGLGLNSVPGKSKKSKSKKSKSKKSKKTKKNKK